MTRSSTNIKIHFLSALLIIGSNLLAQSSTYSVNFLDYQRSIPKIGDMMKRKEDTLAKQF
jgi:hypothetical protein